MKDVNGYESLVQSAGIEIIDSLRMGDYEGDLLVIVKKDSQFGLLITGYGSCSGCDSFERAWDCGDDALLNLRNELYNRITWHDCSDFVDMLKNKDWEAEYYGRAKLLKEFIDGAIEQIYLLHLAQI